jgi:hypothetical protein
VSGLNGIPAPREWGAAAMGRAPARWAGAALLLLSFSSGCAGHAAHTEGARTALDAGNAKAALASLDEQLEVNGPGELPANTGGDNALFLLDRAMVLQQIASTTKGDTARAYNKWSSRDLETADKQVEILDLSRGAVDDIGKYLFSDATGPYKAPTYEKLMINTMNMVNYLVRGDLNGAKVEARRLAVMQRYVNEHEGRGASLTGPGSYLAGFAFEKSKDSSEALRFYDEALEYGGYASLDAPVRRLAASASYRTPRITEILKEGPPKETPPDDETGEILVVVGFGRVPAKIAKRIPIGLALTFVSGALSPNDVAKANYLAAQGLVTWVNYPELGRPRGTYETPGFALDGSWQKIEGALAIDQEAKKAWEDAKGTVVASAITRLIARVATGEVVRQSTGGGLVGALLSLGTQATLTAVDTPDTRSWSTLPARLAIGRVRVAAGRHFVDLEASGVRHRTTVDIAPGGWAVVNITVLR